MFSPEHAIWKFANAGDELDDWLLHAKRLVEEWVALNSNEIKFHDTFDIMLASLLLEDGLLPASARAAFAKLMLETIDEAESNKLRLRCLHIHPPKPGRKNIRIESYLRMREVRNLIQQGKTATVAYGEVAEKYFKSPDTIRRDWERIAQKRQKPKGNGKID